MKVVLLITLLESLAIVSWLILRRFRSEYSKISAAGAMMPVLANAYERSVVPAPRASSRWSFINGWKVEAQADDRMLTLGTVAQCAGSAPARRSSARRSHQRSFKVWSQERHD
jgi:hypothetical protein